MNTRPEKLCGQSYVQLKNGEEISAFWKGGKREGWGTILGPRFEKVSERAGDYPMGLSR